MSSASMGVATQHHRKWRRSGGASSPELWPSPGSLVRKPTRNTILQWCQESGGKKEQKNIRDCREEKSIFHRRKTGNVSDLDNAEVYRRKTAAMKVLRASQEAKEMGNDLRRAYTSLKNT